MAIEGANSLKWGTFEGVNSVTCVNYMYCLLKELTSLHDYSYEKANSPHMCNIVLDVWSGYGSTRVNSLICGCMQCLLKEVFFLMSGCPLHV